MKMLLNRLGGVVKKHCKMVCFLINFPLAKHIGNLVVSIALLSEEGNKRGYDIST